MKEVFSLVAGLVAALHVFAFFLPAVSHAQVARAKLLVKPSKVTLTGKKIFCDLESSPITPIFAKRSGNNMMVTALSAAEQKLAKRKKACPVRCAVSAKPSKKKANIKQGKSVKFTIAASDTCKLKLQSVVSQLPYGGTIKLRGSNITYQSRKNFAGRDTFTVQTKNARGDSKSNTFSVTVKGKPCTIDNVAPASLVVDERGTATIQPALDSCDIPLTVTMVRAPQHGSVAFENGALKYSPHLHYLGADSIGLVGRAMNGTSKSATVSITVVPSRTEFAGDVTRLDPYRPTITRDEARALLKRVGLGDQRILNSFSANQPIDRAAFVEALIDFDPGPAVEEGAERQAEAYKLFKNFPTVGKNGYFWDVSTLQYIWTYRALHGNPLRELMLMHLHDHFAVNLWALREDDQVGLIWGVRDHYEKLKAHAFGSIGDLFRLFNYDMGVAWSLNNDRNHYIPNNTDRHYSTAGNFNYGREILERFTVGRADPYTGVPNYTETDVRSSSKIVSGFVSFFRAYRAYEFSDDINGDGVLAPSEDGRGWGNPVPYPNGRIDYWIGDAGLPGFNGWNSECQFSHVGVGPCSGIALNFDHTIAAPDGDNIKIFGGGLIDGVAVPAVPAGEQTYSIEPADENGHSPAVDQYADFLLNGHPATARHLAYSFFGRVASPHPDPKVTDELATLLRASNYDVKTFLRKVLNSTAMFSPEAMQGCIKNPIEHIAYVLKTLSLPMEDSWSLHEFVGAINASGMSVFAAPTVFGWGLCGDMQTPGKANHGENWLSYQGLLNRGRYIWKILADQDTAMSQEGMDLRVKLYGAWDNPQAPAVVTRALALFQLDLNPAQQQLLVNYLEGREGFSTPQPAWDPRNDNIVTTRLRGLAWMLGMHPRSIL